MMVMWSPEHEEERRQAQQAAERKRLDWIAQMNTDDFRNAISNEGPLANEWKDKPHRLVYDLCNAVDNLSKPPEPIIAVYANDVDRQYLLGYATGEGLDIAAFYDDRKAYGLEMKPVEVQHIPPGFANQRAKLLELKEEHEREIARINADLKKIGG